MRMSHTEQRFKILSSKDLQQFDRELSASINNLRFYFIPNSIVFNLVEELMSLICQSLSLKSIRLIHVRSALSNYQTSIEQKHLVISDLIFRKTRHTNVKFTMRRRRKLFILQKNQFKELKITFHYAPILFYIQT